MAPAERLLADKPLIPTLNVRACLGDPQSGSTVVARGYDYEYLTCANRFEIRRANDCPLFFVYPQPAPAALAVIYPANYMPFQFHRLSGVVRRARDFVQGSKARAMLQLAGDGGSILDAGTGSGMLPRLLARLRGGTENLWANDFSPEVLEPLAQEGFQILPGAAEDLETPQRFRVICLNQVLEHLPDPVRAVRNLAALLEEGGYVFIETPNVDSLDGRLFRGGYWGGYHIPRHFWLFNEESLRKLLDAAGLRVVEVRYLCSPAFWIQSFHHALLDHGWRRLSRFFSEKNPLLLVPFTALDLATTTLGGKTSNIRLIAQKRR
jgi:2-polyprenyl-3-methyl-5-hydroxy-6-metoxy-1,4-benzoquinol methylase